jgi:hypothetical protein
MTTDEAGTDRESQRLQLAENRAFDTSDIRDDGVRG